MPTSNNSRIKKEQKSGNIKPKIKINSVEIMIESVNGQPSNKHTRLIEGNTQRKCKGLYNTSHTDTIDLWHLKEVTLLAKL